MVLGAEARGFILGAAVAAEAGAGFVPARRPGKLPPETVGATYVLEYGENVLEVHPDLIPPGARVVIHDDVLATGGTVEAIRGLVEQLGGEVVGACFIIELTFLGGRDRLDGARPPLADHVLAAAARTGESGPRGIVLAVRAHVEEDRRAGHGRDRERERAREAHGDPAQPDEDGESERPEEGRHAVRERGQPHRGQCSQDKKIHRAGGAFVHRPRWLPACAYGPRERLRPTRAPCSVQGPS